MDVMDVMPFFITKIVYGINILIPIQICLNLHECVVYIIGVWNTIIHVKKGE